MHENKNVENIMTNPEVLVMAEARSDGTYMHATIEGHAQEIKHSTKRDAVNSLSYIILIDLDGHKRYIRVKKGRPHGNCSPPEDNHPNPPH